MAALSCTRLSTRTARPVVFASEEELNEIILDEYQQEAENTTLKISCDSSRSLIGPDTITCTRIGTNQVDWRPTPMPTCVMPTTDVSGTLTQQQQIMIGGIVGGIVLLVIIIGILVYKFCWPFKERVKRTTRVIKRHHYLEENNPEPKPDVVEYVQSLPAEPPSYGYTMEPIAPEPVQAPIQYIEAPMQMVQAPVQMEQPVQMVQEQVFQQPVQMIQEPTQMIYEQPMSVMQMPQQSRQVLEAPMMYEQPMTVMQPPVQMPLQTRQQLVQAPMAYEQSSNVMQAPFETRQIVEAPMMYEQSSNVMQAPLQMPRETRQIVEAPMMYEQPSNVMQAPLQMPRETRQIVQAPMMYEQPLNVMQAPLSLPRESRQIVQVPERRFQSQVMVVPEVQHVRYESPRNQRKSRVVRREYNHRHVGPSVRAISASEHANLKPSKYFVQEPMEEFVTYDRNGRGRTALETMGREGPDGWRTVEAPIRSRTQSSTNSNVYYGSRQSDEWKTSRSHYQPTSRVVGLEEIRDSDARRDDYRPYR